MFERGLTPPDEGLIGFLMRNQHSTPFEMVDFTFRVRCPIGVAREWQRHRTFSYNEESTRYVEMRPDFYEPPAQSVRRQTGKPGAYVMEPVDQALAWAAALSMRDAYESAFDVYKDLIQNGIARELARNVLPLGLLTEFWVKGNLRNWFHFLHLRTAPNALLEIREAAQEVEKLIAPVVPACYAAWVGADRPSM